mmetsp:Transcript_96580/g.273104  ORF Transcript_96580/g.273104 Transcript_96580/m.273104 type:complete len:238 (-) Transcript_96580:360-1073(-)
MYTLGTSASGCGSRTNMAINATLPSSIMGAGRNPNTCRRTFSKEAGTRWGWTILRTQTITTWWTPLSTGTASGKCSGRSGSRLPSFWRKSTSSQAPSTGRGRRSATSPRSRPSSPAASASRSSLATSRSRSSRGTGSRTCRMAARRFSMTESRSTTVAMTFLSGRTTSANTTRAGPIRCSGSRRKTIWKMYGTCTTRRGLSRQCTGRRTSSAASQSGRTTSRTSRLPRTRASTMWSG